MPVDNPAIFISLNVKLLQGFFRYKLDQNGVKLMCNWHDEVENEVTVPFLAGIIGSLVVKHHVIHVLLLSQWIYHEELGSNLLKLLVLFSVFEVHMQEALEVLVQRFVLFDRHLYLVQVLEWISTKIEVWIEI